MRAISTENSIGKVAGVSEINGVKVGGRLSPIKTHEEYDLASPFIEQDKTLTK